MGLGLYLREAFKIVVLTELYALTKTNENKTKSLIDAMNVLKD